MNQSGSFHRMRLLIRVLAVTAMMLVPAATSAQGASSFVLTSASWTCGNPTVQTAWTAQGTIASMHIRVTNTSLDDAEAVTVTAPTQSSHSLVLSRLTSIDKIAVTAFMSDGSVWEYYANAGACGVDGTITGGLGDSGSDISIIIANATCSGFNWSVSSPQEVRVYVSVMDLIGAGMIPFDGQNGTELSGSESFVVKTENQMYFSISVMVYDLSTDERLDSKLIPMTCPIASTSTPTPTVTPDVDDDAEPTVNIQINLPGGESIVGAPYSVFAPTAAQFAAQPYLQGVVGANNTIQLEGLVPGDYRLLVEPEGMDPIDVVFTVGTSQVTDLVLTVDAAGSATVAPRQPVPAPTATSGSATTDTGKAPASSVDTLPTTGAGASQSASPVLMLGLLAAMVTLVGLMVRQRIGESRQ